LSGEKGISRVPGKDNNTSNRKLDLAARAAWLYYIRGRTQDEIATELNVSRQNAQRLVALATAEGLIKFRMDYPITECVEMAERLKERFGLVFCDIIPGERRDEAPVAGIAISAAERIESYLSAKAPTVLALGTGRTLRAAVAQVSSMERPQHKIVSLVGNLTRDGRASPYDVAMRLCDRTGAQCYPLPTPVVADDIEQRKLLQSQRWYKTVSSLVVQVKASFMGIGEIGWGSPLHVDGFITDQELADLVSSHAVGEMLGWAFDQEGALLSTSFNERLTAPPLIVPAERPTIIMGAGAAKAPAIRAALHGRLANGLITDETTAARVLALD
jgi:DNA-binding transcriptional regulator LsrR (DeoR family)